MPQITVNGARHYYRLEGSPKLPALVLIHPIGADLGLWDKVVPLLSDVFHILRYDLRGHGGSAATAGEYSLDMLAGDLLSLTTALDLNTFAVSGVSLGGMTALQAAASAPDRIKAVAVCSVAAKMHPPPGGWDGRARQALEHGMAPLAGPMIERMFSQPLREKQDPCIETLRTTFLQMDPQGYASACAVLRDADLAPGAARVKQPVLVVSGELDALVPPAVGKELAGALLHARQSVLACGHFPPLEMPQVFSDLLKEFFR